MNFRVKPAFSSLEILIVLAIVTAFSFLTISFGKNIIDEFRIQRETQQLELFISRIRQHVLDYQSKWELWGYTTSTTGEWCLVAKSSNIQNIPLNCSCMPNCQDSFIYHPTNSSHLIIPSSDQFYLITLFNGIRGHSKSNHFVVRDGANCEKFIFNDHLGMRLQRVTC